MDQVRPLLDKDIREAHFFYAKTIVTMYWGVAEAEEANARYQTVASGAAPEAMPEFTLEAGPRQLWKLVMETKLAETSSEARRLIQQGGLRLNGGVCKDPLFEVEGKGEAMLKRGKSAFARAVFRD